MKLKALNCFNCSQFYFDMGSPGYSEMTPGCDASFHCSKQHWSMPNYASQDEFIRNLNKAKSCKDFAERPA